MKQTSNTLEERFMQKRLEDREIINKEENPGRGKKAHVGLSKISVLVYETPETCEAGSRLVEWEWAGGVERRNKWGYMLLPIVN